MDFVNKIIVGNCKEGLSLLPDQSADMCVTSPPYWGLRDYGVADQLGQEKTPEQFIDNLVSVFREIKRVLKDDGTLWVNIGDSYASGPKKRKEQTCRKSGLSGSKDAQIACKDQSNKVTAGIKPKDLVGIPWMLAFALRADGWYLRQDIIWSKPNCMPESVTDRCTKSHEYLFMLSKSPKYYYDQDAIKELAIYDVDGTHTAARKARVQEDNKSNPDEKVNGIRKAGFKDAKKFEGKHQDKQRGHSRRHAGFNDRWDAMSKAEQCTGMKNKRSVWKSDDYYAVWEWLFENAPLDFVMPLWDEFINQLLNKESVWTVSPAILKEAHFATFPEKLIVDCIKAGCPEGGVVLDPFMGAGTTALVASKLDRKYIGFELNEEYVKIAHTRLHRQLGFTYQSLQ